MFRLLGNINSTFLFPNLIRYTGKVQAAFEIDCLSFRFLQNPEKRRQAKELRTPIAPLMKVGDVLMFDFRILHRGLANSNLQRNLNRPLLVLAFSIPSFHDTANWPGPSIFD